MIKWILDIVSTTLLTLALTGCATVIPTHQPTPAPTVTSERGVDRSDSVGMEAAAFVGGTMARVKDYQLEKTTRRGALHASQNFTLFLPPHRS